MAVQPLYQNVAQLITQLSLWQQPTQLLLTKFFSQQSKLGARDRRWITQACYEWLRYRNSWQLALQHSGKAAGLSAEQSLALALLHYVSKADPTAAAKLLPTNLSSQQTSWLDEISSQRAAISSAQANYDLPEWLLQQLQQQLSNEELAQFSRQSVQPDHLDVRVNLLKTKVKKVQQQLQQQGLNVEPTPFSPLGLRIAAKPQLEKLACFQQGEIEVQDEGSQLIALLVAAKRDEVVVDYCAGAGGKTLALGAMLRNSGRLYAFDTSSNRLAAFASRQQRSGLTNVYTKVIAGGHDPMLARLIGKADRVLVDAPCSGLGTLRRFPDLKWRQQPADIVKLQQQQQDILQQAAKLVKVGGSLVYATCSLLSAENEQQAQQFSAQHPNFAPVKVSDILAKQQVKAVEQLCSTVDGVEYLRLWPQRQQTDGFFAAVWQRLS